ncbi:MAG: helix-turn-helix domain-containing protein, partial [Bacteroidaceae bacterium]|nr:helix-turn-helix domain-containing protein [Bacteroidaceae bacterium]MBQ6226260.1 helix-turn-helix domain-containing protein [Bacteroidaceae bacterium]
MKSAYKYELADAAGVSPSTFYRWLSRNRSALARLGVSP